MTNHEQAKKIEQLQPHIDAKESELREANKTIHDQKFKIKQLEAEVKKLNELLQGEEYAHSITKVELESENKDLKEHLKVCLDALEEIDVNDGCNPYLVAKAALNWKPKMEGK